MTSLCSPLKGEISPLDTPKEKKALTSERESQRDGPSRNAFPAVSVRDAHPQRNQTFLRGECTGTCVTLWT